MNELKACPFCGVNDWHYQSHFSGATIRQCGECGTIVDESVINTRPIEDELRSRIAELEGKIEKAFDLIKALRMYCIQAEWDNPDAEDEFNEFDEEVCKWLSEFMESEE